MRRRDAGSSRSPSGAATSWSVGIVAGIFLIAGGLAILGWGPSWLRVVSAFVAGFAAAGVCFSFWVLVPLSRIVDASRSFTSGDLSLSVPEQGSADLCYLAGVINNMAADFQEVLLLFSHLIRSALRSARLLQSLVVESGESEKDRRIASEIIRDVHDMQDMVKDFTYFRVRFDGDGIVDTGIEPSPRATEAEDAVSPDPSTRVSLSTSGERG